MNGQWFVRVAPHDSKRETAVEMWRWLQSMGVKKESVERISDCSFRVRVDTKELGELMKNALEERYGR